jgi:two-component system, OmpR family, sensor histidine kinase VanS
MKKDSINFKIFLIVSAFFVIFTTVTMITQSLLIENFYLSKKTRILENNLDILKTKLESQNFDMKNLGKDIVNFQGENNTMAIVINTGPGDFLKFTARLEKQQNEQLGNSILPLFDNEKAATLTSVIKEWKSSPENYEAVMSDHKTVVFKSKSEVNGANRLIGIIPKVEDGNVTTIFMTVSTLQPIGEAAAVIKEFYIYFYIIAIVLILLLSYTLSKMISRPLLKLNKIALKMANFDFNIKYSEIRRDEIGSLGKTLNFLSENLGTSISKLQTANEKLKVEIGKEKKLERMRREFIAGVSHELKTPISIISGYAEGLKDEVLTEDKDTILDFIIDESYKMSLLVNDMLDLSMLESGGYKLLIEELCINDLADRVYYKYLSHLKGSGINIYKNTPDNLLYISADELRMEQVLTNLMDNAIKHTPEGKSINIHLSDEKNKILIEIINEGSHIPEEELSNIWEKFYKLDKSRNRNLGGTGIGLSIVKDILVLHKSQYGVNNTAKGVRFWFTLSRISD